MTLNEALAGLWLTIGGITLLWSAIRRNGNSVIGSTVKRPGQGKSIDSVSLGLAAYRSQLPGLPDRLKVLGFSSMKPLKLSTVTPSSTVSTLGGVAPAAGPSIVTTATFVCCPLCEKSYDCCSECGCYCSEESHV